MAAGITTGTASTLKRLQSTARDALRAVRELERVVNFDLLGRYVLDEGENLTEENAGEVMELLRLAREMYPTQQLEIVVMAHMGGDKEEDRGISTGEFQRNGTRG